MSRFCNKRLSLCLAGVVLLSACSSKPPRPDAPGSEQAPTSEQAPAAPKKLPRTYDNALVLMQSGDYRAAIPVLHKFIEERPELAGPYINLGIAYQHTDQLDAALEALHKAIELNPDNAVAHHQLGILQRELGNFDAALDAYNRALILNPDYALAHRNIGVLYDLYLRQAEPALTHYRRYLELIQEPDKTVNGWVVDLERRSGTAQAKAAP